MQVGATYLGNGSCRFTVWAPRADSVELHLPGSPERLVPLKAGALGYWEGVVTGVSPGSRYLFRLNGEHDRPDPASRYQPEGVHGPSEIIDQSAFPWSDHHWGGIPLEDFVIYELHVGTFTPEGTFAAVIPHLPELRELGVTAIEIMPVAQFPGERNWGYDGAHPFAVQTSYGGPAGFKALVDACHREGLSLILDVVYNHLGPEGNYLREFAPYFTDRYRTPWGGAINFDGPGSDEVRAYFLENALAWFRDYHVDALRLDAVHAIFDFSARTFLQELAERTSEYSQEAGRPHLLIAESDLDDVRLIRTAEQGGYGLHAQWHDDFHHALHTLLTGDREAYYQDFGSTADLCKAFREGFVYDWRYSPYRQRRHGSSSREQPARQFVVCSQNHDQIGNRMQGERLITVAGFAAAKTAAAAVLFSPYIPLLFMGEEYGEEAPFLFFVSFPDPDLAEAVRRGRREEFSDFSWKGEPPDPQDPETFCRSRLKREQRHHGRNRTMFDFYRQLLHLRKELPALRHPDKENLEAGTPAGTSALWLSRWKGVDRVIALFNLGREKVPLDFPAASGGWKKLLDSAEEIWQGPGSTLPENLTGSEPIVLPPQSCALYRLESKYDKVQ
jgi:maltooligosyltrehalose trehalohydrolase